MELLALIWFVSWIATIIIAALRGGFNQGCLAIFTGALFGPIALIVALSYKANICPYCKERIQKDAIVCPHCRKELNNPLG